VVAPAPNPLAEPDLAAAERIEVVFEGGAMGRIMRRPGGMETMREMMSRGAAWLVNGEAMSEGHGHHRPLATLKLGRSYLFAMRNETAWHHPIHLHGHVFRVVSRNGEATRHREWRDTVMIAPDERVEIAFVADNPGRWMFHCHILEHQGAGMMAMVEVG
jgi:FtsP/CotA-like multicopper oxidase with cupredoxin domain